jgi:hypothetical protein
MIRTTSSPVERSVNVIDDVETTDDIEWQWVESSVFLAGADKNKGAGHAEDLHGLRIWDGSELTVENMGGKLQPRHRYARLEMRRVAARPFSQIGTVFSGGPLRLADGKAGATG